MDYTGNLCPGCGKDFCAEDDIVVCPECGTPQHRECYDKENKCVCSHLHGDDYAWQGTVKKESPFPQVRTETISCPNCGYDNPKGTPVCKQCGMKFTIFGMNIVDAMHEEEKKATNPNNDIPDYDAPFAIGKGEAFEPKDAEGEAPSAREVQQLITDVLTGNSQGATEAEGRLNLGGPFPATDEIDGVMTNNIGNFIGTNAMNYIAKFKKMQSGRKLSFNFAAFFFSSYWFFYRKLYKAGIVAMTVLVALSIIATPYINGMLEVYEKLLPMIESGTVNEAQFAELYNELIAASTPMAIYFFASLVVQLICGFIANPLYKKYVVTHAGIAEKMKTKNQAMAYVVKFGGASLLIATAAYFANQLLTMLVSMMM